MTQPDFSIINLPHIGNEQTRNDDDILLIKRYRKFRLEALQLAPDAFASSYFEESQLGDEYFESRLRNLKATHFVAVSNAGKPRYSNLRSVAHDVEWMGMLVSLNMTETATESAVSANTSPWTTVVEAAHDQTSFEVPARAVNSNSAVIYHLSGAFTVPHHRRKGVGSALLNASLEAAELNGQRLGARVMKCTLYVEVENKTAKKTYERAGFVVVGKEKYTPRPDAAGPRQERTAVSMELRRDF